MPGRRLLLTAAAILAAVVVQVTFLNNLPFPGGSPPSLVLVVVVTLGLVSGPRDGAVIGFCAGLATDIAPPAIHLVGQSALVFCLTGYLCGCLRGPLERSSWLPLAGVALGVAGGEALFALAGLTFGDPDITWQSIRHVLPVAVVYDLLLSPFVLYLAARLAHYGAWDTKAAAAGPLTTRDLAPVVAGGTAGLAAAAGAVRDSGTGHGPKLKAADRRADGWIGGGPRAPGPRPGPWVHRSHPSKLRLRGGVAGSATGMSPGQAVPPKLPTVKLRLGSGHRGDGTIGGPLPGAGGVSFGGSRPRGPRGPATRPARGGPAPLRAAAFTRGQSALAQPARARGPRAPKLRLGSRHRGDGLVGGGVLGPVASARPGRGPGKGAFSGSSLSAANPARPARRRTPGRRSFSRGATGSGGGRPSPAAVFLARRRPGASGALRVGRGTGAVPRFRGSSGRRVIGRWRGRPGRRSAVWRIGGKRMGGLS